MKNKTVTVEAEPSDLAMAARVLSQRARELSKADLEASAEQVAAWEKNAKALRRIASQLDAAR